MTLSALGIFSAAGAGGAPTSDYELLETQILGSEQSSVVFSNLNTYASTYKHLQIRMVSRLSFTATTTDQLMRFNGVTSSSYAGHRLVGNGSSVFANARSGSSSMFIGLVDGAQFTTAVIDVLDFTGTKNKTVRSFTGVNGGVSELMLTSGLFDSTAAITSLTLFPPVYNYVVGSRFSLYGIKG